MVLGVGAQIKSILAGYRYNEYDKFGIRRSLIDDLDKDAYNSSTTRSDTKEEEAIKEANLVRKEELADKIRVAREKWIKDRKPKTVLGTKTVLGSKISKHRIARGTHKKRHRKRKNTRKRSKTRRRSHKRK
jgi:hypothetical protein